MKFILATKQHMTQFFGEDGTVFPATVLTVGPITVTQVKTKDTDGYEAVQVGFGAQKTSRLSKSVQGHLKGAAHKILREFRGGSGTLGDVLDVSVFTKGDVIQVSGISKGKGFQGVVKRHGFVGGWGGHGQKHSLREPGSIGATGPQRVFKGTRMAGRMGSDRITVKNLVVLDVDTAHNTLLVRGAVPGKRGTLLEVRG